MTIFNIDKNLTFLRDYSTFCDLEWPRNILIYNNYFKSFLLNDLKIKFLKISRQERRFDLSCDNLWLDNFSMKNRSWFS